MTRGEEWFIAAAGLVPGDEIEMGGQWWAVAERGDVGEGVTLTVRGPSGICYPCPYLLHPTAVIRSRPCPPERSRITMEGAARLVWHILGGTVVKDTRR